MKLHEFTLHFNTEEKCRHHFRMAREKQGIICKNCSSQDHYWLKSKSQWQCKQCRFRTTLRSGTAMQKAKLSFQKWYLCMAIMSATKKGISAKEMQRQLGHKRYRTIWVLMQKIRYSMSHEEILSFHQLFGPNLKAPLHMPKKEESISPLEKRSKRRIHFAKFNFRTSSITLEKTARSGMYQPRKDVYLDRGKRGRENFKSAYKAIICVLEKNEIVASSLKWINIIKSNFESSVLGVYHRISLVYLAQYLDEFSFRLNRREQPDRIFDRLVETVSKRPLWYE